MSRLASVVALSLLSGACACTKSQPLRTEPSSRTQNRDWAAQEAPPVAADEGDSRAQYRAPQAEAAPSPAPPGAPKFGLGTGGASRGRAAAESSRRPLDRETESRPGLGTEWGETRSSRVSNVSFDRDSNPFSTTSILYNDEAGVRNMTRDASMGYFRDAGIEIARGALTVRLLDSSGSPFPTLNSGSRNYVVGQDGERYSIEIQNHTGNSIEAVTTVDGLDVIDGKPGTPEKRGYLIAPWSRVEIDGFRRSFAEVAAFRFGAVRDSYAARKGNARNVGVIGIAFFAEAGRGYPWLERESDRRHDADPFPGRFATPPR